MVSLGSSSLLAVETSTSSVIRLVDTNNDGLPDSRTTVARASGLNHGLALHGGYLYASNPTTVYRWAYSSTTKLPLIDAKIVVQNMNDGSNGIAINTDHATRTLAFDASGRLYISVGSTSNVDSNSFRARIRRFNISSAANPKPIEFITGEVFADGLRNEVGLAFDVHQVLWGVENGADNLNRTDLGGDIHNDNPVRLNGIV
jgi:glucose/arabinose dehydrogenase